MYENRHGRFTAVDPLLASGKSANPQTFNRFVYCLNNPLVLTDPDGLQVAERVGSWYKPDKLLRGQKYNHPRFVPYDEKTPKNHKIMSPNDHVYYNQQRADAKDDRVWSVLHPYQMLQEDYKTKEEAIRKLYEWEPNFDPNRANAKDQVGYLNIYGGYTFPQLAGFGLAGGVVLDRETQQPLPQAGIVWQFPPGPIWNGTYSPMGASDGLNLSGSISHRWVRSTVGTLSVNTSGEPSVEAGPGGGSAPTSFSVGLFYVHRPVRSFMFDNTNLSEQSINGYRNRLGFSRPRPSCVVMRCNSNSNTNTNSEPR